MSVCKYVIDIKKRRRGRNFITKYLCESPKLNFINDKDTLQVSTKSHVFIYKTHHPQLNTTKIDANSICTCNFGDYLPLKTGHVLNCYSPFLFETGSV